MPPDKEDASGYRAVVTDHQEHLIPVPDGIHDLLSTCSCGPLQARNVRGASGLPTWYHRSMAPPL